MFFFSLSSTDLLFTFIFLSKPPIKLDNHKPRASKRSNLILDKIFKAFTPNLLCFSISELTFLPICPLLLFSKLKMNAKLSTLVPVGHSFHMLMNSLFHFTPLSVFFLKSESIVSAVFCTDDKQSTLLQILLS